MPRPKIPETEWPQIVSLYESGNSIQAIIRLLNRSYGSIRKVLIFCKVKLRTRGESIRNFYDVASDEDLSPGLRYYAKCKREHLCFGCGRSSDKTNCRSCVRKKKAARDAKISRGICTACTLPCVTGKSKCQRHIELCRSYHRKLRVEAFSAYGGPRCVCCGIEHLVFLALDHIDNNGSDDRRKNGMGTTPLRKLKRAGWPPGFQVLCHNCNFAKQFGQCPHKTSA